jgi:hypothetical protein
MTKFRWKNCFADVQTSKHDLTIHSYLDDVIVPALATLDAKISELGVSDWPGHQFAQADMEAMKREATLAFGLSIQSIWDRQLRSYLRGCANELRPGEPIAGKIDKANWKDLQKLFRRLRGINLDEFPSFPLLDTLQHLGNACRHGDGDSAVELHRLRPDLWPVITPMPPGFGEPQLGPAPPPAASMEVPVTALREFVTAIAAFWRDAEYIYNESIERKHENLEAHLVKQRTERTWFPQARSEVG